MNEIDIINKIKSKADNNYIGDDCAFIKEANLVITQDSFIENVHFKRSWYTPYQLGYKSTIVNISDVLASGAKPEYITIALSLPNNLNDNFVEEFYDGVLSALNGGKIIGGDITGSKSDIVISITALGSTKGRNISSRKNAKSGYIVLTKGMHGTSSAGLKELLSGSDNKELINAHIRPELEYEFSKIISTTVKEDYAMMDTSDGLADALFKIAESSGVKICVDYNKIPHLNKVSEDQVLFGGEDYKLVAVLPEKYADLVKDSVVIGYVSDFDGTRLDISGKQYSSYDELKVYNHFGE